MPWVEIAIREQYGWRCADTGFRRYQTSFWGIPRKNSKTETGAGLALGHVTIDEEPGAEAYILSFDEDQAAICYNMAKVMIENRQDMVDLYDVTKSAHSITHLESGSIIRALPGDFEGLTGLMPSYNLFDEFHELKKVQGKIVGVMRTGMGTRRQPLTHYITTAGRDITGPAGKEWIYARKVKELKVIRDRYMPLIFEAEKDCDPGDKRVWVAANPGYGHSIFKENFEEMYLEALTDPLKMDDFMQYQLNMWVNKSSDFINYHKWLDNAEAYGEKELEGMPCYGGLDLADTQDMTSFALQFPFWEFEPGLDEEGKAALIARLSVKTLTWYWVPQSAMDASDKTEYPYGGWVQDNLIVTSTPYDSTDYVQVRKQIKDICKRFKVQEIGYDPRNSTWIAQTLQDVDKIKMTKVIQTFAHLNEPTKRFRDMVNAGDVKHNGNKVLNWNVQGAKVILNSNKDMMIGKTESRWKIDGLAAHIDALFVLLMAPPPKAPRPKADIW